MILLTGASGLLGGHLLIHLVRSGKKVRALRRTHSRLDELQKIASYYQLTLENFQQKVEWIEGDLLDPKSLTLALQGIDEVYHCAAVVSFSESSAEALQQTNILGTANLIDACLKQGVQKFAFSSSIGALGQSVDHATIDERTPWHSNNTSSAYSNSKYHAEQEVWKGIGKGLRAVIINPGIILGAGDFSKGSLQFFSQVDQGMRFYTRSSTGYVDVRDVCRAMILLMEREIFNERFVLVSQSLSNHTLLSLIAEAMGKSKPSFCAGRVLLQLAYHLEKLRARFTHKSPLLTKEIIQSALKEDTYSSQKIKDRLNFQFIDMRSSITHTVRVYNMER